MPISHVMSKTWRLMRHTLNYICCTKLQNCILRQRGKRTQQDMLEPIALSIIWTIASIKLASILFLHYIVHHSNHNLLGMLYINYKRITKAKSYNLFGWFDIKKWSKDTWVYLEDLLKLSNGATKYVVIEERLLEPLKKKWEDAKRTKREHYITNINPKYRLQYKARMHVDHIQSNVITNKSINSCRALIVLTQLHKLGNKIALSHQNP